MRCDLFLGYILRDAGSIYLWVVNGGWTVIVCCVNVRYVNLCFISFFFNRRRKINAISTNFVGCSTKDVDLIGWWISSEIIFWYDISDYVKLLRQPKIVTWLNKFSCLFRVFLRKQIHLSSTFIFDFYTNETTVKHSLMMKSNNLTARICLNDFFIRVIYIHIYI